MARKRRKGRASEHLSSKSAAHGKSVDSLRLNSTNNLETISSLSQTSSTSGSRSSSSSHLKSSTGTTKASHPMGKWIDLIQEYAEAKGIMNRRQAKNGTNAPPRMYRDMEKAEKCLLKLCDEIEQVFSKEHRVLKLKSPVVVIADLHGNLHDLLIYNRLFFDPVEGEYDHVFLFTGDYVDRGPCSAEVIIFLFAMKLVFPERFFMLRGNHEIAIVNKTYTFFKECHDKFSKFDEDMYERFNRVFDCMPMCAVIDGKFFCCHGGIPAAPSAKEPVLLKDLRNIPCPLPRPDAMYPQAWELVWNDPMENPEFHAVVDKIVAESGRDAINSTIRAGFSYNFKRFTGYYFNEEALRSFLHANKLSTLIRGHELCKNGIMIKLSGLCYTVFSTSKYSNNNSAGVIIIEDGKILPRKIDTDHIPN